MTRIETPRRISGHTTAGSIEDGIEWRSPEALPSKWEKGHEVVFELADNTRVAFYAEPEAGQNVFSYKPNDYSTWHVRLERLPADKRGWTGLKVHLEKQHKFLQRHDGEEGDDLPAA